MRTVLQGGILFRILLKNSAELYIIPAAERFILAAVVTDRKTGYIQCRFFRLARRFASAGLFHRKRMRSNAFP